MLRPFVGLCAAGIALATAGCTQEEAQLQVTDAWVRISPVASNPSAGYFTVKGGEKAVQLIGVSSPVAIRTEMHETMADHGAGDGNSDGKGHGMTMMKPVTSVDVPARGTVAFAPGGRHAMFWNINPGIVPPRTMPLVFTFSDGTQIEVAARTVAVGAPAPK
ncbi:copper chaperone PCu(A)C [Sphingomonas changnyeongensis]|uniref:Copper chaperone PCu(A)C n=1 Tax=Sphingomonas changnyeongensis TaxID=2698679 RepID=A0A7Z2S8D5_9SPHN|nr:copper chaperone PCu(A)C [Sphingomonas changnyeongensis]QHL91291.1 copper chaperone PCu(A)C [Sphingomonas changnyeongensis]